MAVAGYMMRALDILWEGYGDKSVHYLVEEA